MKLLPYDVFEFETPLPLEETITALKAEVEPKRWFRGFSREHMFFEGEVTREGFKIMRIINYRNSFLPVIRGTFKQSTNGIDVMIRMSLHPIVLAFMCIWFGGVLVSLLAVGAGLANNTISFSTPLLIPLGMLIFGWVMVVGGFWFEAKKAKPKLILILKGRIKSKQIAQADRA